MAPLASPFQSPDSSPSSNTRSNRPPALRTQSEREATHSDVQGIIINQRPQSRRNSTFSPWNPNPLTPKSSVSRRNRASSRASQQYMNSIPDTQDLGLPSPPITPSKSHTRSDSNESLPDIIEYDFTKVDYQLDRARILGTGLWSNVLLADAAPPAASLQSNCLTPPNTPPHRAAKQSTPPSLYAVKLPLRRDAVAVFNQEARVLSHLCRQPLASDYVVPFYGQDVRNDALIFEAVIGGTLESLTTRLKQMTEVARHLELISIFPGLAHDLIGGLHFLHSNGVVHADIKPGNILLDMQQMDDHPDAAETSRPVLRARYIDFSASFRPADPADSTKNAGGSWDFLAPEQMRIQKEFNTPTPASDVWSLAVTLLSLIVGGSPYTAAVGKDNLFMLREAIKTGDPIGFAKMDPRVAKRIAACQDFVDCVRLGVIKDREKRTEAGAWKRWVEVREW